MARWPTTASSRRHHGADCAGAGASGLGRKDVARCKNYFALGLMFWLFDRPIESEIDGHRQQVRRPRRWPRPTSPRSTPGYAYGETHELSPVSYQVKKAAEPPGLYRNVTGDQALALGLVAASPSLADLPLFLGSYPDHARPRHPPRAGRAQALRRQHVPGRGRDRRRSAAAIGAAFGGAIGVTATAVPGIALKTEAIGLAVMTELPLVIVNVQRGGPQHRPAHQDRAGRPAAGDVRPQRRVPGAGDRRAAPADCFDCAIEAWRIAVRVHDARDPALTDGYIANGAEPWRVPDVDEPAADRRHASATTSPAIRSCPTRATSGWRGPGPCPARRAWSTASAAWRSRTSPATSTTTRANHQHMVDLRAAKVAGVADDIPPQEVDGAPSGDAAGGQLGRHLRRDRHGRGAARGRGPARSSHVHLRYLNPFPANLGEILGRFDKVLVPELNLRPAARCSSAASSWSTPSA